MQPKIEEIFVVDELGQQVSLIRVTPYTRLGDEGSDKWEPGEAEFRTADGVPVTALEDGTFEVAGPGTRFRPAQ
jgi:hypothetical protein